MVVLCGMPQYSIRIEAVCYVCASCLLPAFDDVYCHVPVTEWFQRYLPRYLFSVSNSGLLFFHVGPYWFTQYRTLDVAENLGRYLSCWPYTPEKWLWIDSNGKIKTRHPVEGYFGTEFQAICNHCGVMAAWSRKT